MSKKIKRALISVSDKNGLEELVRVLSGLKVEILSTGGTLKKIREWGLQASAVEDYTGFPEMMDGRVKTLHPRIHGGLLGIRSNPSHMKSMEEHGIQPIDLVVINLYPFETVTADPSCTNEHGVENIDIGGPSMVRSAAKNHNDVAVVTDASQYPEFIQSLKDGEGSLKLEFRKKLAAQAFAKTAAYDATIAQWFAKQNSEIYPDDFTLKMKKVQSLRYGENPHQSAVFYSSNGQTVGWKQLHGKELSYNNLLDLDSALTIFADMKMPFCALLKHTNPCGIAANSDQMSNLKRAMECDPVSFFGGIGVFSEKLEKPAAEEITKHFMEIIIAPAFSEDALAVVTSKKNLRVIQINPENIKTDKEIRSSAGGYLIQQKDYFSLTEKDFELQTSRKVSGEEMKELLFAFTVVKSVKSNAIVFTRNFQSIGIGAGQMSRVDSMRFAMEKARLAGLSLKGSYLASDAFFPFKDAVELAVEAGVNAIIQPGGSIRDEESTQAAEKAGISMIFTGTRHFRH